MSDAPKVNFSFWPLSGKAPLKVNFINDSENLGGYDEWSICPINKKYNISHLNSSLDTFYLNFLEWENEGIRQTCDENGFKLETITPYYYDVSENKSPIKTKFNDVVFQEDLPSDEYISSKSYLDQINIDLTKNFSIELTIVKFKNYYGSIQLYFESLPVNNGGNITSNDIGIHINTNNGEGNVRDFNNLGINLAVLKNYSFPVKVKFVKVGDLLELYVNNNRIHKYSSNSMGVGTNLTTRNSLCPLKLKIVTRNNISNSCIHIKDIYITNDVSGNSNLPNNGLGFHALYNWDFGDGAFSSEKNPVHVFNTENPKNVKLSITTENGSNDLSKNISIYPNSNNLPNASEIFKENNEKVVKDLNTIPDYCSNNYIKNIINAAIYDSIRHTDSTKKNTIASIKFSVSKTEDGKRNVNVKTYFKDLFKNEYIVRTLVERSSQNNLVNSNFELEDPE